MFVGVLAVMTAWFWAVAAHDPKPTDGQYPPQDTIDSDGDDAWLSSLTH
jgi:hypothetical protein